MWLISIIIINLIPLNVKNGCHIRKTIGGISANKLFYSCYLCSKLLIMSLKSIHSICFVLFFIAAIKADEARLFFQVNMSWQIEAGNFDPENDFVDIAGTFNNWGEELTPLSDPDNDSIYEIELTGFLTSDYIEFKFRRNGQWDGSEEFPGGGANRTYNIEKIYDSLYYWYNDELPANGPPVAGLNSNLTSLLEGGRVDFTNHSMGNVLSLMWYFEGGNPQNSAEENPSVLYTDAGTFDVQLIAYGEENNDTLRLEDYIQVNERDESMMGWWNNTVFYEIFVRSFYDSDGDGIGDFQGIIEKLDYLNDGDPQTDDDLGITGIWLMPVHPSPSYHGYDATDYSAIHPDYGSMDDFKEFLEEAHARGIRVILDYVMNHTSSQHPWFQASSNAQNEKRDFYSWSATNPGYTGAWGQQVWHQHSSGYYYGLFWGGMPDLNYHTQAVKDTMFGYATYWLDEIGVDGFRLDAIGGIFEDGQNMSDLPKTIEFWKDFSAHTKSVKEGAYTVGEAWTNTPTVLKYVEDGGLRNCFEFELAGNILHAANHGAATALREKAQMVYNIYPHNQWGSFLTNHDMDRVLEQLEMSEERNKLAASILLTIPGAPFIYYGEEIGMTGTGDHMNIRRPMQWDALAYAGFSTVSPWNSVGSNYQSHNVATESNDPNSLLNHYKKMIRIRNSSEALQTGRYTDLACSHTEVFSFLRHVDEDTALVLINSSDAYLQNLTVDVTACDLQEGSNTFLDLMSGEMRSFDVDAMSQMQISHMGNREVLILSPDFTSAVADEVKSSDDIRIYPNPVQNQLFVESEPQAERIEVYDAHGQLLISLESPKTTTAIDVSALPKGSYFLKLHFKDSVQSRVFVRL